MKKIAILKDDTPIANALAVRLEAAGYEAFTAPDGLQGLRLVLDHRPDLILMDVWMPVGIGFSVAQRLKGLGMGGIPIIYLTASKRKGLKKTAKILGAAGFFEKPYDADQLLATIAQALEQTQRRTVAADVRRRSPWRSPKQSSPNSPCASCNSEMQLTNDL